MTGNGKILLVTLALIPLAVLKYSNPIESDPQISRIFQYAGFRREFARQN